LALAHQEAESIPRRARVLGLLCPLPSPSALALTLILSRDAQLYCLTADARLPRARTCNRPAPLLQCIAHRSGDPGPKRTCSTARPAKEAAQPLHSNGSSNGSSNKSSSNSGSSTGLQLLTSRRGPGLREPLGYIGLHKRTAPASLSPPRLPPTRTRVGPSNATRQPNRGVLRAARPAVALLPPTSAPLQDWWRPAAISST
jgi:hypothetical protein